MESSIREIDSSKSYRIINDQTQQYNTSETITLIWKKKFLSNVKYFFIKEKYFRIYFILYESNVVLWLKKIRMISTKSFMINISNDMGVLRHRIPRLLFCFYSLIQILWTGNFSTIYTIHVMLKIYRCLSSMSYWKQGSKILFFIDVLLKCFAANLLTYIISYTGWHITYLSDY
jgi:hypothetical protein